MATNTTKAPPKKTAAKQHPADKRDLAKIAQAASFSVHFRRSPSSTISRTAATLTEARKIAAEINAEHGRHGRRCGIYAHPKGKGAAVLVPADYQPPAGPAPAATEQRMSAAYREIFEAARKGKVPAPPDFSANTHAPYRKKLAALVALVKAKDISGLASMTINPTSTSPKAMARYRDTALLALTVAGAKAKAV